jgi:hypothetical protein
MTKGLRIPSVNRLSLLLGTIARTQYRDRLHFDQEPEFGQRLYPDQ